MGSLFSALTSAGQSIQQFERAMNITENNVTNANSPGYAKQVPELVSQPFQANSGLAGGVTEVTQDTRDPMPTPRSNSNSLCKECISSCRPRWRPSRTSLMSLRVARFLPR